MASLILFKMKNQIILIGLGLIAFSVVLHSCKKDKTTPPVLTTAEPTEIAQTTVTSGGNISSDGGEEILVAGICWSTSENPSVKDKHTNNGKELGIFTSKLTGLTANTKYYIKAYAYNKEGTGYGNEVSFITSSVVNATLTTAEVTSITSNSAKSGGNITADGGGSITVKGICWSTSHNPTTADNKTSDGTGTGTFTSDLTGLTPNTLYYIRAYAINSAGTSYGNELSFTTLGQIPTAMTLPACCINATGATLNGTVNANYLSTTVTFEYGITTAYGNIVTSTQSPVTGNSASSVSASISGLNSETTFHFRVKATNSLGSATGNDVTFATSPKGVPTVITTSITSITLTSAVSGGNATNDGGEAITAKGVCWNTTGTATTSDSKTSDGTGTGNFTSNITGLTPGTTYYLRAYATNSIGTTYGNEISFATLSEVPSGQIIADHRIVSDFDKIPAYYINEVKKMWFDCPGESHASGILWGIYYVMQDFPAYLSNYTQSGTPEAYTTVHLRTSQATWGDLTNSTGWKYLYGEQDWFTNATGIARTKAGLSYCSSSGLAPSAFGFAWCTDMEFGTTMSSSVDPVYGCHWHGVSENGPDGNRCWGLDDEDNAITGNSINLDTYLSVTQQYIDYCTANSIPTKVFFSTGPVNPTYDGYTDEKAYQAYLKMERIRNYVKSDATRILFDYADILCYDDNGTLTTNTWDGQTFPAITTTNLGAGSVGHIGRAGCLRLGKAVWWMLARMAGWDGN